MVLTCSAGEDVNADVYQGSVLGTIFVLIYINESDANLSFKQTLDADDTSISKQITGPI